MTIAQTCGLRAVLSGIRSGIGRDFSSRRGCARAWYTGDRAGRVCWDRHGRDAGDAKEGPERPVVIGGRAVLLVIRPAACAAQGWE